MTTVYVREQGTTVCCKMNRLRVTKPAPVQPRQMPSKQVQGKGETKGNKAQKKPIVLQELPILEVEQVQIYGNVQVTTQAMALLLKHNVDVVFLSLYGQYRGRLMQGGSKFAKLRHAQLQFVNDEEKALSNARAMIQAKIANQTGVILELLPQSDKKRADLQLAIGRMQQMEKKVRLAHDPNFLRGVEGQAGALYFGAIRSLLDPAWSFKERAYHPPPDAFNTLLSFCYSLLLKDVNAAIQVVGLDPFIGSLHTLEYGRPSLVLDLMEEFRPLVADRAVLDLVFNKKLKLQDFTFTGLKKRPVELGKALIPTVIQAYEAQMNRLVVQGGNQARQTARRAMELQAHLYARVILGDVQQYVGVF